MNVVEKTALLVKIEQAEMRGDWAAAGHLQKKLERLTKRGTK